MLPRSRCCLGRALRGCPRWRMVPRQGRAPRGSTPDRSRRRVQCGGAPQARPPSSQSGGSGSRSAVKEQFSFPWSGAVPGTRKTVSCTTRYSVSRNRTTRWIRSVPRLIETEIETGMGIIDRGSDIVVACPSGVKVGVLAKRGPTDRSGRDHEPRAGDRRRDVVQRVVASRLDRNRFSLPVAWFRVNSDAPGSERVLGHHHF